jgi:hypothetical protein
MESPQSIQKLGLSSFLAFNFGGLSVWKNQLLSRYTGFQRAATLLLEQLGEGRILRHC